MVGQMKGVIKDLEVESSDEEYEDEEEVETVQQSKPAPKGGMFSIFRGLVGSKNLTKSDMEPVLEKMKDHLIAKNVAADISEKLCDSVATKLEGKVLGTFDSVATTVKNTLNESLVQILSPKRRVDILRDCMEAQKANRPYVMTFCGVSIF
uniref:Signal recognition particle receptor subunit alpha homolog n=1 Tax=Diabrotica virgifera virgifera TaxID=50390 RepID=A0A6P7GXP9_DIAVI